MKKKISTKLNVKDDSSNVRKDIKKKKNVDTKEKTKMNEKNGDEKTKDDLKAKRYRDPLSNSCLKLYEKANKLQTSDEKLKIIERLVTLLSGKINSVIFRHDMSRVIQLILKYGLPQHKNKIANEMLTNLTLIATRKYSNHLIKSVMIHCGSSIRSSFIKELQKNTLTILRSKIGVQVLELVYKNYCNSAQRNTFKMNLFGIALNINGESASLKEQCERDETLAKAIMSNTKSNLLNLLQKGYCIKSSIATSALHDYLLTCSDSDKEEIKDSLLTNITDLITTKGGCYCALQIMWICSAKEKKSIIKQLQEDCVDISADENGSFFILSLFDCVDDTVLLNKILLSKLMENIRKILENEWGHRIIDYMFLHHLASNKLSRSDKDMLQQSAIAKTVKKDAKKRLDEIKNFCYPSILKDITNNADKWLSNAQSVAVFIPVFKHGIDSEIDFNADLEKSFNSIANFVCNSDASVNDIILHVTIKNFIFLDEQRVKKKQSLFSHSLLNHLNEEILTNWIKTNRGCFFLVILIELEIESVSKKIHGFFESKALTNLLKEQTSPGGKLLNEKINSNSDTVASKNYKKQKTK